MNMNLPTTIRLAVFFTLFAQPLTALALTPSEVFDRVKDSVVVVKVLNGSGAAISQGSGVLLPTGKIATNCHVIKDGIHFQVGRGKSLVPAVFFAGNKDKDICLLQSDKLTGKSAQLGKAASLKVGEAVYAIGAPQGLELSLSDGIVSALRGSSPPLIQTTAAISPGSSGGGLFNNEGLLVGLTTLYIDGGQSLNFAMPVEWLADIRPGKDIVSKQRSHVDWITRAIALEEEKHWSKLLDWGRQWVKADPENTNAWMALGSAHRGLSQHDLATAAYREALRIDPKYDAAWGNLGVAYQSLKQTDNAIAAYREALRINQENVSTWNNLGNAYGSLQRTDDAITAYHQALQIDPSYARTWVNLGGAYNDLKRYDDAITAYREALRVNPGYADAWNNLGFSYKNLQRYDEAIVACRQALRINPENTYTWINLATTYYLSGNTPAALEAVANLRRFDSVTADKLFNMFVPR